MATNKSDQIFDVEKPGKKAPDATSRPLLAGRGNTVTRDPMVSPDEAASANDKTRNHTTKVIAPLNANVKSESEPAEPQAPETNEEPAETTADEMPKTSETAAVDAVVDEAASKKKEPADEEAEKAKQVVRQHIDQLIANKTYFLPIGQVTRKRNARNGLILLVVLLVVVAGGGYLAYTMGLLKNL